MAIQPMENRAELLIREIRQKSGHQTYDYQSGIQQRDMVLYLNDAQDRLTNLIMQEHGSTLKKSSTISIVAGTASYTLPTDVYLGHNIVKVEYTTTGNYQDAVVLNLRTSREEVSVRGFPDSYFVRDGFIILSMIPNQAGQIRIEYQYVIPQLGIRVGQITAFTDGFQYTPAITAPLQEQIFDMQNGFVDFVSVVDSSGTIICPGIAFTSYDATTNTFTLATPASTIAVGQYVVFGKYASTHSMLPQPAKRYLIEYAVARCQTSDSNALETQMTSPYVQGIEAEVLDAYAVLEEDIMSIPVLDYDCLGEDY
jgi:hypothetical protein